MLETNINFYFSRQDSTDYTILYHTHKCYEMVYYYSGSGYCYIDGKRYDYKDNTYVIIPPGARHNDIHSAECSLVCIGFSAAHEDADIPTGKFCDDNGAVKNYIKLVEEEFNGKKYEFISAISALLNNIIIETVRKTEISAAKSTLHKEVLEQALNFVNEYYLTDITPEQLSAITNYSYHRFRHIFKNAFGVSPKQYILNKRFEYAKKLLSLTDLTVTEISYQCGFSATSLFIKQFKKNAGVTPAKYRVQLRSQNVFSVGQTTYLD